MGSGYPEAEFVDALVRDRLDQYLRNFRLVVSSTNYKIVFRQRSRAELRTRWPGLWVLFLHSVYSAAIRMRRARQSG